MLIKNKYLNINEFFSSQEVGTGTYVEKKL